MTIHHYVPPDEGERLPPIFLDDLDAILPVVIKVNQSLRNGNEEIDNIDIFSSMESATSTDYKTQAAGILCECYDIDLLPVSTVARIHAAIKTQAEISRRHRVLDESLNNTLRSIMAGL